MHGHETSLLVVPDAPDLDRVAALLESSRADVVAFSFMTCRYALVSTLVDVARRVLPNAALIAGGAHPTTYPSETLRGLRLDAVCVGEGEVPLQRFLENPDASGPGILRAGEELPIERWWATDVDALPDWDRGLFGSARNQGNRYEAAIGVAFARGFCPYACTFCGVDGYRRINGVERQKASRLRSTERVLQEIERARRVVSCDAGFASWDEVLPGNVAWITSFFHAYRERVGLPFACQLRVEQVRPELVDALVSGGCDYVVIGVETGDEDYRRTVLNKPFSNARVMEAFSLLHAAKIRTFCSFMLGLPFETPRMLAASIRLAEALAPSELSWKYYTPERGTVLFGLVKRKGLVIDKYVDHPFGAHEAMIQMSHCTQQHLDKAQEAFRLLRGQSPPGTYETDPGGQVQLELRS